MRYDIHGTVDSTSRQRSSDIISTKYYEDLIHAQRVTVSHSLEIVLRIRISFVRKSFGSYPS